MIHLIEFFFILQTLWFSLFKLHLLYNFLLNLDDLVFSLLILKRDLIESLFQLLKPLIPDLEQLLSIDEGLLFLFLSDAFLFELFLLPFYISFHLLES
jgi:hypothetical protein